MVDDDRRDGHFAVALDRHLGGAVMSRWPASYISGLSPVQHAIIEAYDRGLSHSAIAETTGLTVHQVRRQLAYCGGGPGRGGHERKRIIAGSAALLAAIARHHPERVRP